MFRKGMQQAVMLALSAILVAGTPAAVAASDQNARQVAVVAHENHGGLFARTWQWVQSLWAEEGGCIDPDGRCTSGTTAPLVHTDQGGCLDPDGRCAAPLHRP